jgi:hypothetical protein
MMTTGGCERASTCPRVAFLPTEPKVCQHEIDLVPVEGIQRTLDVCRDIDLKLCRATPATRACAFIIDNEDGRVHARQG